MSERSDLVSERVLDFNPELYPSHSVAPSSQFHEMPCIQTEREGYKPSLLPGLPFPNLPFPNLASSPNAVFTFLWDTFMSSSLLRLLWSQSKSTELFSISQTILECWQVLSMQFFYWGYSTGLGSPGCASFYDLAATRWGRQSTQHFLRGSKLRHAHFPSQIHTSGEQQGEESDSHSLTQNSLSKSWPHCWLQSCWIYGASLLDSSALPTPKACLQKVLTLSRQGRGHVAALWIYCEF